jgi:hypothetical protein
MPFALRWQLDAHVAQSSFSGLPDSALTLEVETTQKPTPISQVAIAGLIGGVVLGAGIALLAALFAPRRRRLASVELGAGLVLIGIGAYLSLGLFEGRLPYFGPALVLFGAVIAEVQLVNSPRLTRPSLLLVPGAMLGPAFILGSFASPTLYRDEEVLFGLAAVGLMAVAAIVTFSRPLLDRLSPLDARSPRLVLALAVMLAVLILTISSSVALASTLTLSASASASAHAVAIVAVFMASAFWYWLGHGTKAMFVVSAFTPLLALVAYPVAALDLLFSRSAPVDELGQLQLLGLAIGGVLLAALTFDPPPGLGSRSRSESGTFNDGWNAPQSAGGL